MLSDPRHTKLDITNALHCSLQQLRLTESDEPYNPPDEDGDREIITRNFGSLTCLQSLQLTDHEWAELWLPLRCVPNSAHLSVHVQACRFAVQAMVITSSLLVQANSPPPGSSRRLQWVNPGRHAWGHLLAELSGDTLLARL